MSTVIRIPESLYRRLEDHVTGFDDTPAKIIERMLDFYDSGKGLVKSTISPESAGNLTSNTLMDNLAIVYYPNQDDFKKELIVKKCAYIKSYKIDGSIEFKLWNAPNFTISSSLSNNLRSGYLRGWKGKGIYKVEVSTNKADFSENETEL
jgi:hypothetical protein